LQLVEVLLFQRGELAVKPAQRLELVDLALEDRAMSLEHVAAELAPLLLVLRAVLGEFRALGVADLRGPDPAGDDADQRRDRARYDCA